MGGRATLAARTRGAASPSSERTTGVPSLEGEVSQEYQKVSRSGRSTGSSTWRRQWTGTEDEAKRKRLASQVPEGGSTAPTRIAGAAGGAGPARS